MNSESIIKYSSDFNANNREIWFSGEAYFKVAKNSDIPLQVYLGKATVVATGTKFNIFSHGSENRVETTLEEGSVQIEVPGKDIVYVIPGQQVIYFKNSNTVMVKDVTIESFTSWKENKLRLNDTPFEEALRNIARRYNVTFEIQDTRLLELKYTATFIDESIEDVMQMLKRVSPIKYKIINRTSVSDKTYLKPKIVVTHN
jgi:ferric-dicitrate binding protein FerR (iron transport regulator)